MSTDPYLRYDYAWNTPGFTAQNPTFNYGTDGYVAPGMPEDISLVRVWGNFLEMGTGRSLEGVFRVRVNKTVTHTPTGFMIPAGALRPVRFNSRGFSLHLPATDDEDFSEPFAYEARLTVRGRTDEFTFSLPSDPAEVNVTSLIHQAVS